MTLPTVLAALELSPPWAVVAAILVVLAVILLWKLAKLAFKVVLIALAAAALFLVLTFTGFL